MLSRRYNTSIDAIRAANPGLNPSNLTVGRTICIPTGRAPRPPVPTPPPASRCPVGLFTYTIQGNETLWLLSQRYCTTVETIMALNPGINPNNLMSGQTLWIAAGYRLPNMPIWFRSQSVTREDMTDIDEMSSCREGADSYTIEYGDTLWLLSQRFQIPAEVIMAANPGINPNNLFIGQVICIPGNWNAAP